LPMKKPSVHLFLIFTFLLFCIVPVSRASTVSMEIVHSQDRYPAGGRYPIVVRLRVAKSWAIHTAEKDGKEIVPTTLSFSSRPGLNLEAFRFPQPEKKTFQYTSDPIEVLSGQILVRATLVVHEETLPGPNVLEGRLSYQACSASACLPPEDVSLSVPFLVAPKGAPVKALNRSLFLAQLENKEEKSGPFGLTADAGLFLTLIFIFLGGLALNLTPCIYPLIPITVSYFGGKSRDFRGRTVIHCVLYMAGLAFTNSVLGLSAALSGRLLGAALQNPYVLLTVAAILIALGLSSLGFWEFRMPSGLNRLASRQYSGYFGTFFMGLTLGILAAPCLGPFLLGLLTYVGRLGKPFLGFLYFFVLSIGLGLPLTVLAFFSGVSNRLPVSGDWMVWIRKLMGWVLIGMAAYVISPLFSHIMDKSLILGGIAVLAGIHLGWIDRTGKMMKRFSIFKRAFGLIMIGAVVAYFFYGGTEKAGIRWIPYHENLVSSAKSEKKPLIMDFSADWCSPCRAMERKVFTDPEVLGLSRQIMMMRVDLTTRHASQDEILGRYRIRGVPTILFINKDGSEEVSLRIESYVDKSRFFSKVREHLKKNTTIHK